MSRFEDAIEIDAPAERAFDFAADPRNLPRIDPSASIRLLSGGWTEVGSRHHVTNRRGRSTIDSVHEITRYEPPQLVEERITSRTTVMVVQTEIRPIGQERSVVIVRGETEWGGSLVELVSRLIEPLTGPPMRRRALARLKEAIEDPGAASPDPEAHLREEG